MSSSNVLTVYSIIENSLIQPTRQQFVLPPGAVPSDVTFSTFASSNYTTTIDSTNSAEFLLTYQSDGMINGSGSFVGHIQVTAVNVDVNNQLYSLNTIVAVASLPPTSDALIGVAVYAGARNGSGSGKETFS